MASYVTLQPLIAVLLLLVIYDSRIVRWLDGLPSGEAIGLFPIFYSSFLLLIPLNLPFDFYMNLEYIITVGN